MLVKFFSELQGSCRVDIYINVDKRTLNWNIIVLRMDDIVFEGKLVDGSLCVCVCNYENASM
jgi:hypothetical protein